MERNKSLVCKEPELRKKAASLRLLLLEKEENLFSTIGELCAQEVAVNDFLKREVEPKLSRLQKRLENLKFLVLGRKEKESSPKTEKTSFDVFQEKKLKELYRKLAKIYHPDFLEEREEKAFFVARMKEINEAFAGRDLQALHRILKRANRELEGETSAFWTVKALKEEIRITEDLGKAYLAKLEDFKKSKKYSLMKMRKEDLALELSKLEEKLKEEIEVYASLLYGNASKNLR